MKKKKTDNTQKLPLQIEDSVWDRIQHFFENRPGRRGENSESCRLFFSAILWIAEENVSWCALPTGYGKWRTIYQRFKRWCNAGVFELLQAHFHTDKEISTILNTLYTSTIYAQTLKTCITNSLKTQGFKVQDNKVYLPENLDKEKIRDLHTEAVRHKIEEYKKGLIEHEPYLIQQFAHGEEIVPEKIDPKLVPVYSEEERRLFRYAGLHWSIPVSLGYGRRLRYLVIDQHTNKLMGLLGLGDPVFSLGHRDRWVGWNFEDRKERLHHVVDAFVLGAVPPYSFLIGGKLIALLATSNEVREAFKRKYKGKKSVIRERKNAGEIAMITTTSALERSSMYNRLKCAEPNLSVQPDIEIERLEKRLVFERVGHTQGFGEFHFSNGIYGSLITYAKSNATATASHESWGPGFRNKQEVVQKALRQLGLPKSWLNHGIKREIYVAPLAENTRAFLCGNDSELNYYDQPVSELFRWYRQRWLLPRSKQSEEYKQWNPEELELWQNNQIKSTPVKRTNVSINQQNKSAIYESKSTYIVKKKKSAAANDEKEFEGLITKAIDRKQMFENAFENHEISDYLTYEEFVDVCISTKRASITAWQLCAASNETIRSYSNYLRRIRGTIAVFETLTKGINYGNGGAAWIRDLLLELKSKSKATGKSVTGKDSRGGRK